jgi:hypothetical protein
VTTDGEDVPGTVEQDLDAAEEWFVDQGLPWFVDPVDARVRGLMGRRRVRALAVVVAVLAVLAVLLVVRTTGDVGTALLLGAVVALVLPLGYAVGPLRLSDVGRWAARQVLAEINLLLPLVTRALPLLLLFMTFLFVNTEVWQVASVLTRSGLYAVVLLFSGVGVAFLLTRLPEEVRHVQATAAGEAVAQVCRGTPLEERAAELARGRPRGPQEPDLLTRTQQANLLLVLLVTQALQVLLLAASVFVFFIAFGLLAIPDAVVRTWIGRDPTPITWDWHVVVLHLPVSDELYQVSVFLSAFAGLYFTVYAVSDATYREQFFAEISRGLERAVGVREVYRALRAGPDAPRTPAAPAGSATPPASADSAGDEPH